MCFAESRKYPETEIPGNDLEKAMTIKGRSAIEGENKKLQPQDGFISNNKVPEKTPKRNLLLAENKWSWVILTATFFNYMVVSAIWYSFSVLYKEFADHFDMSLASIGGLASVEAASLHFTGALCSGLVEKYGSRPVAIVGSFIASVSLFAGAFVNDIVSLYIVYGVAGGGIGLSYVSFVVIIQVYFDKKRTLASGFSLTGFSIASFCLPPFTRWILDLYGWRGTMMILACFYLNGMVLAALLRPPPKPRTRPNTRQRTRSLSERLTQQMSFEQTKTRMNKAIRILQKVFDYRMFKNVSFVLYGFGTFFMMVGNIGFFMHLVNRARSLGIEKHMATFLPSIYGIANGICRLLFSVIASMPKCNRTIQYGAWIVAGGLVSCLSGLATDFIGLAVVCAGFGMCVGAFICIQYPALVDLLGVKKIARSTGLLQLFIGTAGLIATPMAGRVYDITGNYDIPYYVMGSIMVLGGAIVLIIPCIQARDEKCGKNGVVRSRHNSTRSRDPEAGVPEVAGVTLENLEDSVSSQDDHVMCQERLRTLSANSHLNART